MISHAFTLTAAAVSIMLKSPVALANDVNTEKYCVTFEQEYADAEDLCNRHFGDSFFYQPDDNKGYTMWFFEDDNPNDAISRTLGFDVPDTCEVQYYHKDAPSPEEDTFTECHPWKNSACCDETTVESQSIMRDAYGPEYSWDICGVVSPECARFYVQEICMYECDPNISHFRRFKDMTRTTQASSYEARCDPDSDVYDSEYAAAKPCKHTQYDERCDAYSPSYDADYATINNCEHNAWQINAVPVKGSYCRAWYNACRKEPVCKGGNVLECGKEILKPEENQEPVPVETNNLGLEIGVGIAAGVAFIVLIVMVVVIVRERRGRPLFMQLRDNDGDATELVAPNKSQEGALG